MRERPLNPQALGRLAPVIGEDHLAQLLAAAQAASSILGGRTVWNVSAIAAGGGVAEILNALLPYARSLCSNVRWLIFEGDPAFFAITKRLCNGLYGIPGDGKPLGNSEHDHYKAISDDNADYLRRQVRPGDVVLFHDPQTAGLISAARRVGATTVWRCHLGRDSPNDYTERAWAFLRPYLMEADAFVFSTARHVPAWIGSERASVIPPSIDPFSAKNFPMLRNTVTQVLQQVGILGGAARRQPLTLSRPHGPVITIAHPARVAQWGPPPPPDVPVIAQISRWDRLKDMTGVMRAFAAGLGDLGHAHLVLVAPEVHGVVDDPEAAVMFDECYSEWRSLPPGRRKRIQLACLPMADLDENAAVINAIQRHATIVVQKSLAEGFGLTVTEAMWKARPIVASAVGGIADQIVDGQHGLLLQEPTDPGAFVSAMQRLLAGPPYARKLGRNARSRVVDRFLGDRHLIQYSLFLKRLLHK
jgi:trehalose synthase